MIKSIVVASVAILLVAVVVILAFYYISYNPNSTSDLLNGGGRGNSYLSESQAKSLTGVNLSSTTELCTPEYYQSSESCNAIATEFGRYFLECRLPEPQHSGYRGYSKGK
jgi:1,6-anhydro-N-acetylmuramate kinase